MMTFNLHFAIERFMRLNRFANVFKINETTHVAAELEM